MSSFSIRLYLLIIFSISVFLLVQREQFKHKKAVFKSAESINPKSINAQITDPFNYYKTGKYDINSAPVPKLSLSQPLQIFDILSRKKMDCYLFTQYNLYKTQINFIDLGYSSFIQFNFWSQQVGSISLQQKIGFSLQQDLNELSLNNININKNNMKLYIRQFRRQGKYNQSETITTFNITISQQNGQVNANYTHIKRDQQCVTIVRDKIISYKCYGGYGYGKIKLTQIQEDQSTKQINKRLSAYNPKTNLTRCSFDALRGSGWNWKWQWMYATGFSKPEFYAQGHMIQKQKWIAFNLGQLNNKSQDFLFINSQIYPIQGLKYYFDDKFTLKKNITFISQSPKINMTFYPLIRHQIFQDMGILKNDMIKSQGHWAGYIVDPLDGETKIHFYQMSGIIENVNSKF